MRTLSAAEYKKLYGDSGVQAFTTQPVNTPPQTVGGAVQNAGKNVSDAITGQGVHAQQSSLERGISATASAFGAIPAVATAALPDAIQKPVEQVGEAIGSGFKSFTDWIGSNPSLQKWTQEHPDATDALMRTLQTTSDVGAITGTIAGAKGGVKTLQKGVDVAKTTTQNVVAKADDAFGTMGSLRPTTAQIAVERGAKIRKGFEEQNTRLKSADAAFTKNTIVRKSPDGATKTITPIDTFADNDIAPIIDKGSIQMGDYKLGSGPLGIIKERVQAIDNDIDTKLVNTGQRIQLNDLQTKALDAVRSNTDFKQEGTVSSNLTKVQSRFDDYRMSYGDTIDVAELNNIRKVANRDWKPETQDTSRVIGDVARNYVYDAIPDNEIKSLLQKQAELLAAKKYGEKINGTKVTGGRLGNYAMRTAGAVLGSTVEKAPVIGPVAGMLGGEAVARLMQQSQFKSAWTELRSLIAKD